MVFERVMKSRWALVETAEHSNLFLIRNRNGTVLELYFPVTREEVADKREKIPLEAIQGHGETILVVDDEARQREIACAMLSKLGYTPQSVASGEEAIKYVREHEVDMAQKSGAGKYIKQPYILKRIGLAIKEELD